MTPSVSSNSQSDHEQNHFVPRLSYRTTSGAPNTTAWGAQFQLSKPSLKGGFIIQKIETTYKLTSGLIVSDPTFWEAFRVVPGSAETIYANTHPVGGGDDWWGGKVGIDGHHGVETDIGTARFYEALTPNQLKKLGFTPDNVGSIGGTVLPNTYTDPKLSTKNASAPIIRISSNPF